MLFQRTAVADSRFVCGDGNKDNRSTAEVSSWQLNSPSTKSTPARDTTISSLGTTPSAMMGKGPSALTVRIAEIASDTERRAMLFLETGRRQLGATMTRSKWSWEAASVNASIRSVRVQSRTARSRQIVRKRDSIMFDIRLSECAKRSLNVCICVRSKPLPLRKEESSRPAKRSEPRG